MSTTATISAGVPTNRRIHVRRADALPPTMPHVGRVAWSGGVWTDTASRADSDPLDSDTLELVHTFTASEICDDAVVSALQRLVDAGAIRGQWEFEEAAVGLIRTSHVSTPAAWAAFYDNSLRSLRAGSASFAPVHRRARSFIAGASVLEVGCCFGFFALQCAEDGLRVGACDISAGAIGLLTAAATRRGTQLDASVGDATALEHPDDSVDTVTLIHLLEHLDAHQARTAISEALRVARRRVIIAIPYEEHPREHFGHLHGLGEDDLRDWAAAVDHAGAQTFEDHGGWLILTPHRSRTRMRRVASATGQISPRLLAM